MRKRLLPVICAVLLVAQPAAAEIYKWVDKDGKVHFSDQPKSTAATEISAELKPANIDNSGDSRAVLKQIFSEQSEAEREYQRQQQQPSGEQQAKCAKARYWLSQFEGPVAVVNDSGKPVKFSERERQQLEAEARAQVKRYCRN